MKSFRRSRSVYLRASSSSMEDRDDHSVNDLLLMGQSGTPPLRRCGSLFVESIHKLKCSSSSASKGVALLSQSDVVSVDRPDTYNIRDEHIPPIDPLKVYPSLHVYNGSTRNFVTIQCQTRRREDDASDDALTAPRRFLSPSHLQNLKPNTTITQQHTRSQMVTKNDDDEPYEPAIPPVATAPHLCDIPECVVIPRSSMNYEMTDSFQNEETSDGYSFDLNTEISPFQPTYYDDIPVSLSGRKSARKHDWNTEDCEQQVNFRSQYDDEDDDHRQPKNMPSRMLPSEVSLKVNSSTKHALNTDVDAQKEWDREDKYTTESVPPNNLEYEIHDRPEDRMHHSARYHDHNRTSEFNCYDSNVSREFSMCSEGVPAAQRTYYLASPTEETTKMSSLSKKLRMDQLRSIAPQASDTSFATTKSGATQATSHSTSTGISRSSRKTQELIRRFERHGLQKTGHTPIKYDKGTIKLPK